MTSFFKSIFFFISPILRFKIEEQSMSPTLKEDTVVLVNRLAYLFKKPKIGDIVVLKRQEYIIKRIVAIGKEQVFVIGDNKKESIDSRHFGWILKKDIVGKVIFIR